MKRVNRGAQRDLLFNGEPQPVIEDGEYFIELPNMRLVWGLRELVRSWVVPPNLKKNGPGVIPQTIFYKGCEVEEISWDFNEDSKNRCEIKMSDGSVAKYPPPRIEDISVKQALKAILEMKAPTGKPGRHPTHKAEVTDRACAWIYKLHVQEGKNQIPAAKAAIRKHHLGISTGWLLQKYREHPPKYWEKKLNELSGA